MQGDEFMRFYGLKSCDTCRRALKELRAAGLEPEVVDVRADGLSDADRGAILSVLGAAVLNTRSTTWRGLDEAERAHDPAELLADHPTLMKRPVIADGDRMTSAPMYPSVRLMTRPSANASAQIIRPSVPWGVSQTPNRSPCA